MNEYFEEITDPRQEAKVRHSLVEIIVMTICAVIAGCDVWEDIADFCRVKKEWLQKEIGLKLENGVPSHDTLERVWSMLDPKEFEKSFISWVSAVTGAKGREIISVDGKTLRGSGSETQKPIHMVSAWASKNQLVLGQLATQEKSNEITAVPELLNALDIKGTIITADAMSCQKVIVTTICDKKADYVIGLKGNQATMLQDTQEYFASVDKEPELFPAASMTTAEKGHGRIEQRQYELVTDPEFINLHPEWKGLHGIGRVSSHIETKGQITEDVRYFITSLTDIYEFATAARSHWGVENSLHWCLDMTFREDYSRIRKDHSAENMAVVRHIALDFLKKHPAKMSIARKRRHCAYDDVFLAEVVNSIHA